MSHRFAVVDLFAGPGGLAEGFSRFEHGTERPFDIRLSVEKEKSAHQTLLLRSFLRQFGRNIPPLYFDFLNGKIAEPDWEELYPDEFGAASRETLRLTLGDPAAVAVIDTKLAEIRDAYGDNTIVVGGPPCQAYSLVGRSRNRGKESYVAEEDGRHYLYREYIRILGKLRPAAFVMENVKGLLSASVDGSRIFDRILTDLKASAGERSYELYALAASTALALGDVSPKPSDFLLRAEDYGVPQARHRVIILGLRSDVARKLPAGFAPKLHRHTVRATVADVLDGMPHLRSGLSRSLDDVKTWSSTIAEAGSRILDLESGLPPSKDAAFRKQVKKCVNYARTSPPPRAATTPNGVRSSCPPELAHWLVEPQLQALPNNETRGHMASDLARYLFAAAYAQTVGASPKASDFPNGLAPRHQNWTTGKFSDRFRVQLAGQPSSTVTSHISKDGHYFIHPDPTQCRSLTVREAARLQTFPDDYLFRGNRTEQYVQVGNAVPPFLARQIAESVWQTLTASDASHAYTDMDSVRRYVALRAAGASK